MIELRHPPMAPLKGPNEVAHGVEAHPVPVSHLLQACGLVGAFAAIPRSGFTERYHRGTPDNSKGRRTG